MNASSSNGTVVVGAGQAAQSLIEAMRRGGYSDPITVIGLESYAPYQRPPLSKSYLLGETSRDRLALKGADWYASENIDLLTGTVVEAIHPADQTFQLGSGQVVVYENLVLATGAEPRKLPASIGGSLSNVHTIRSLDDIDAARPNLKKDGNLLVIGGGYIGLEMAAVARKLGMAVTLVEAQERILARVAGKETAAYLEALHRTNGVNILTNVGLNKIVGEDIATSAVLSDGTELPVSCVVVGIGAAPNVDLADAAGLKCENGILVNASGQTSDPNIWAIGDCANYQLDDGALRLESVGNAIDTAHVVAANLLGDAKVYDPRPWFWSDQYDTKLQIAGLSSPDCEVVIRNSEDEGLSHWYYQGTKLVAIDALSAPKAYMVGRRLLENNRYPSKSMVADATVNIRELMQT